MSGPIQSETVTYTKKVLSAVFFLGSTVQFIVVSKTIIPHYYADHPTQMFEMIHQAIAIKILWFGRYVNLLQFPHFDRRIAGRMYPILLLYFSCMATTLDNFGIMNDALFSLSRRIVLLITITMVLERFILDVEISRLVKYTIATMVIGAMIGGTSHDSIADYFIILLNHSFWAGHRVYLKKILDSRELGVSGLMYYSTIIKFIPSMILACYLDVWTDPMYSINVSELQFWSHLLLTTVIGIMLSCSSIMCIKNNGVLTTTILGGLVNTLVTVIAYFESVIDNDGRSKFSWLYCIGWTIIVLASLVYICVIFKPTSASNNALVSKDECAI